LKQLQDASNFFSNSCRNAEMLVDGALSRKTADMFSACMKVRRLAGDDEVEASARCKDRAPEENATVASSTNPFARAAAQRDVNIIWSALRKTDLGHAERELYMNLAGTVIVRAGDTGNQVIDPTVTD
ncbi:conjugal transfer protein TraH, partial [Enterobacter hormaechei]|uniref:conjugal transfer protein TraH n=1 Tax=Enterobacter hormaechei TaxID=158836 RepID=UPI00197EA597